MKTKILIASLTLFISCFTSSYSQNFIEVIKAVASDRGEDDRFGSSVSISNNIAIVGAPREDHDVNGGNAKSDAGAAYIFERDGNGNWNEVQKLVASDRAESDWFGVSVAISGNIAIIGAMLDDDDENGANFLFSSGSAYIFKRDATGVWGELQKIVASDRGELDEFGNAVAISGGIAVVGAVWEDHDENGGNTADRAGSAYVFELNGSDGLWYEKQKIVASDRDNWDDFGNSVSVSAFTIIVGAYSEDHDVNGGNFMAFSGSVYIFQRDSNGWHEVQKIVASDREEEELFGRSVAIYDDKLIVGADWEDEDVSGNNTLNAAGSAYIFERNGNGVWNEVQKIVASDRKAIGFFGYSVSIFEDYAMVGAYGESEDENGNNPVGYSGASYVFKRNLSSGIWSEVQKIVASDRAGSDVFGKSVAISGCNSIVGALQEDEDVNGNNTLASAGSAYFFECNNLGIDDFNDTSVVLFPNPTNNHTTITLDTDATYTLVNIHGQILQQGNLINGNNSLDVSQYSNGLYFVNVKTDTGSKTLKLIKQ